ncbi:DMT family transporter [Cloacibacillus porcorum]|uniref:DMT family transporter n=4 Tax=Cloacibacillus porcorum TaxID=1197717 RepID=UPI001F0F5FE6|nr:DMT family transporter [Cloacibacillus porcorum]MCC8184193.1 DMT family transporter [Cloacibacillus porcorum]MDY5390390.1 DMT family transporter [Cloacibacillus porcorum]
MMDHRGRSLLEIHIAVLLFGLTGLFGKSVDIPARYIVLGRVFFASLSMGIYFLIKRKDIRLTCGADYTAISLLGALLAFHWTAFYTSVQVSTVAIALLTFSAYPIFVTFLEPLMFRERLKKIDVLFAFVMFMGVLLIVPEFNIKNNLTIGLLWGMAGSVSFAVMSLLNRRFASSYEGSVIAFYEQGIAALVLLPMLLFYRPAVSAKDWGLLILLGVLFTGVAHSLFIGGMKHVRAQTAGIIASLESVYGIISAALILGEIPSLRELVGGAVILGTAAYSTLRSSKEG